MWPTQLDLLKMPLNQPVRAVKLRWKNNRQNADYFGAIQVVLSNGVESPVFFGRTQNADNLREIALSPEIKKIRGTKNGEWPTQVIFQNKAGDEIANMFCRRANFAADQDINEEEIIGVYGHCNSHCSGLFKNLGFIVWVPPKV